jgi:hypothetical protein
MFRQGDGPATTSNHPSVFSVPSASSALSGVLLLCVFPAPLRLGGKFCVRPQKALLLTVYKR